MGGVVAKTTEVDVVVGGDLVAGVGHMVGEEDVQDMGQVQGDQVMEEQLVIVDLGDKKDSETRVVEQRDSEIQVEQPKDLETRVVQQKDLVIPVAHLNRVVIITNLVDMMPPKHKMEVDITICVILNMMVR
jgi:hypothetical protein